MVKTKRANRAELRRGWDSAQKEVRKDRRGKVSKTGGLR